MISFVIFLWGITKGEFFSWCIDLSLSGRSSLYYNEYAATMFNAFLAFCTLCGVGSYGIILGSRISCTVPFNSKSRRRKKRADSGLGISITLLLMVVLAIISGNDQVIGSERVINLVIALIAIIVAVLAEIALKVLTRKYCRGLSVAEMNTIVCGFEKAKEDKSKAKKNQNKNQIKSQNKNKNKK